ncbi:sigma 54-interacting transcriptional regulator [bacterium]|nr:sigma 54-interacting transcriptional regulator [bacterium]
MADLAACFVQAPLGEMDEAVRDAQRRVCEFLGLDRSTIWQFMDADMRVMQITHLFQAVAGPETIRPTDSMDSLDEWRTQSPDGTWGFNHVEVDQFFPWAGSRLRQNQASVIERLEDLPEEARLDREFLRHYGTKSVLILPLAEGDAVIGMMTFAMLRGERVWPDRAVEKVRAVAGIFAHAIARTRIDNAVHENEARLMLAAESANAGLWDLDMANGVIRASAKTRELVGLGPDETLNLDSLMRVIHPEDIGRFSQIVERPLASNEHGRADFRIVLPDGGCRWIQFGTVRSLAKSPGEPARIFGVALDITDRKQMEDELRQRVIDNEELKRRIESENVYQAEEFKALNELSSMVGQSGSMQAVFKQIKQVGPTHSPVLITGETGTGKELVARAIHAASARKNKILVIVNCATLPATLIESELFGREKGAYTGALTRQVGRFELANGGTLFLDEIGELSVELQGKLLRVLQEGEFERLGNPRTIRVDVRLIAATNRNLVDAVNAGTFRKDLYYRLSVFPIELPPLSQRTDDIPLLVWAFIDEFNRKMGKRVMSIPQKTMESLRHYSWPGNVRELRNVIERAMIVSRGDRLELEMPGARRVPETAPMTLEQVMQQSILDALKTTDWRIKGPRGAAALLGLRPSTLYTKMKKLNIPLRHVRDGMPS